MPTDVTSEVLSTHDATFASLRLFNARGSVACLRVTSGNRMHKRALSDVPAMPTQPPNRSDEYRKLAEKVRTHAEVTQDQDAREALLQAAFTWERLAFWERHK